MIYHCPFFFPFICVFATQDWRIWKHHCPWTLKPRWVTTRSCNVVIVLRTSFFLLRKYCNSLLHSTHNTFHILEDSDVEDLTTGRYLSVSVYICVSSTAEHIRPLVLDPPSPFAKSSRRKTAMEPQLTQGSDANHSTSSYETWDMRQETWDMRHDI